MRTPERDLGEVIARMAEKIVEVERRCRELEAALAEARRARPDLDPTQTRVHAGPRS